MLIQATEHRELVLSDLVDEIMRRMQAGESIDIAALTKQHPDLAGRLGELQPAVQLLAELRQHKELFAEANSIAANSASVQPRHEHFQPGSEHTSAGILGDFRLVREIGRGGMGVVFEAEQISLGRTVALKMLPYAGVLDEKHLQRFKNEARAAATLEHPHIVPVYSIGCERGVHFFTMRYIEGQSLAEVLQAIPAYRARVLEASSSPSALASQLANLLATSPQSTALPIAGPESNLPLDKLDTQRVIQAGITTGGAIDNPAFIQNVARLGIQAADALAYAHERGILHRDVKPGNLLLDAQGDLWVADFGLARLEQDAGITITGDVLGTLRYMSPEQALGQTAVLDERADVYSLGVTLYEMLTLRPAFAGRDRQEILRRIATEEPQSPRQIDPRISRDLETIVLKAMSKEVAGRYQTAGQLADDLRRYLDDKPIQARRPTRAEQLVKWSRRHPSVVWATVLVLLATTIVSSVSTLLLTNAYHHEAASAQKAREAAVVASNATQAQVTQRRLAEENARRTAAVLEFLVNALRSPEPEREGRNITIAEVLDRAAMEAQEKFAHDPLQANLLEAIGQTYQGLGLYDKAVPLFEKTRDLRTAVMGPDDPDTLRAMSALAVAYDFAGRVNDALLLSEETLKRRKAKLAPDDPDLLKSLHNLAWGYLKAGRSEEAVPLFEDVLERRQAVLGPDDPDTLITMGNLAEAYRNSGHQDQAVLLNENTLALMQDKRGPDHPNTLVAMNNLALAYVQVGRFEEAVQLYKEALKLFQTKLSPDHPETLTCMHNLGMAYKAARRFDEALPILKETLRLRKSKLGPDDPVTIGTMTSLGATYLGAGRPADAVVFYEEVFRLRKANLGDDHLDTLSAMRAFAKSLCLAGRQDDALPLLEEALKLGKAKWGVDHLDTLETMRDLAEVYKGEGRLDEAISLFEETLTLRKAKLGPDHTVTIGTMLDLARAYERAGRTDDVIAIKKERLDLVRLSRGPEHSDTLPSIHDLADTYQAAGRLDESAALREELLRVRTATLGPNQGDAIAAKNQLALLRIVQGKVAEAETLLSDDLPTVRANLPPDSGILSARLNHLALALLLQGKLAEAEPLARESLEIRDEKFPNDWSRFNAQSLLGAILLGQKKYAEAEALLVSGYDGMKLREDKAAVTHKFVLRQALEHLVQLYEATNQPEKVSQWKAKLNDFDNAAARQNSDERAAATTTTEH
jgi:eukaryotic-like serine/threonine-protein kinase